MLKLFISIPIFARRPESSGGRAQAPRGEALSFLDFFGSFFYQEKNEQNDKYVFHRILTTVSGNFLQMTAIIIFPLLFSSCEQILQPTNKLIVYVNDNDEVPAHYRIRIYRGDELVKSDEFDQEYSGFNNLTEIVNPPSGTYYFHAHSGDLSVRDSLELVSSASIKFVHLDLRQ